MMVPRRALSAVLLIAGLAALLALTSCATRVVRPIDEPPPPPFPSSPERTLQLLEWCYDHRSMPMHRTLFAADYRFFFSSMDSAGADYRGARPWTRDDELTYFIHLVNGGAGAYPAK